MLLSLESYIEEFESGTEEISDVVMNPSRDVIYQVYLQYLSKLAMFISKKYRKEND